VPKELPAGDDRQAEVPDKLGHVKHPPGLPDIAKLAVLEDDAGNHTPAGHVEGASEHRPALMAEVEGGDALSEGGNVLGHEDELGFIPLTEWVKVAVTPF
jgi:hypothetical protein